MPNINLVGMLIIAVLAVIGLIIRAVVTRNGGVPTTDEQQWIDKLGLQVLYDAYIAALKASAEPDEQRDIVVSYLVAMAESRLGIVLPLDMACLLYEFIADLIATRGETEVADMAASGKLPSKILHKGA